ncbi:lipopolysaccharide biosynthesis protein [Prevotella corporis]|uniref:lipopolysaccharide biosynthesis protein n=1 Tax=Prevotella corporis TaxID=28128 RepID=UPI002365164E|nr:lipopolysaccharide biosynthesis protein [Prevotella corporis]
MEPNLRKKTTNGLLWSSVERFSNQGVQFLFSIVLARLLTPEDYGIVAMVVIFFAIAQTFVDSGFSSAIVRKKDRTESDLSTCFYFNIFVGLGFYILLFQCSPFIADFYDQPILSPIVKISGLTVLINSLCIVQQAQFTIRIDFKTQAKVTLTGTVMSGILGILLAYLGYGVWALVWQGVTGSFVRMILFWILSKWRPRESFSKNSFHYLFGYGSKLLASGLLDTTYNNIYPIVIGKFYSPAQLGNFTRAQGWASLPSSNITGILQRVTFPVLTEMQDDDERLATNYRKLLRMSAFVVFPLMMLMAAIASPLIRVVITAKWDACVPYLQIMCFAMMWYPIHAINLNLLQVKGRSDLFLRLEIIKKVVGVSVMCVTIPLGVKAMCYGMIFTSVNALLINTYYTGKLINVGFIVQMKDLTPILITSIVSGIISYYCLPFFNSDLIKIIISTIIYMGLYFLGSSIFSKKELSEVLQIIRRK